MNLGSTGAIATYVGGDRQHLLLSSSCSVGLGFRGQAAGFGHGYVRTPSGFERN